MSLISYLNSDSSSTSTATSSLVTQALQTIAAKQAEAASTAAASGEQAASVSITLAAQRAAAETADAGKTADALTSEIRAAFDADDAAAGEANSADLTALSGRALALVALDDGTHFTKAEMAAARTELRARDRQALVEEMSSTPLTASSLKDFLQARLATRQTMSAEERQLRDSDPSLR